MKVEVKEQDGRFFINFGYVKTCEVSFSDRREAETIAYYLRDQFERGREDLRYDLRNLLGLELGS